MWAIVGGKGSTEIFLLFEKRVTILGLNAGLSKDYRIQRVKEETYRDREEHWRGGGGGDEQ